MHIPLKILGEEGGRGRWMSEAAADVHLFSGHPSLPSPSKVPVEDGDFKKSFPWKRRPPEKRDLSYAGRRRAFGRGDRGRPE